MLHPIIHAQATAYPYHLAENHPFVDGNKRTADGAMEAFLRLNGYRLALSNEQAYNMVIQVAQGEMTKNELSDFLAKSLQKV